MKKLLFSIAFILLLLNGAGAIYGGWNLVSEPDGSSLGMSTSLLHKSPFDDFLIPGIVLLTCNGLFSFVAISVMLLKKRRYPLFILAQGVLLTGWIFIQMMMIQADTLQFIFGGIGVALMFCGLGLYVVRDGPGKG